MKRSAIKKKVERIQDKALERVELEVERYMIWEMRKLSRRFPKRTFWFLDAMGSCSITVHCGHYNISISSFDADAEIFLGNDGELEKILNDWLELVGFYIDLTNRPNIQISDIYVRDGKVLKGSVKWPQKREYLGAFPRMSELRELLQI